MKIKMLKFLRDHTPNGITLHKLKLFFFFTDSKKQHFVYIESFDENWPLAQLHEITEIKQKGKREAAYTQINN